MSVQIRRLLISPVFKDEEKSRIAGLVHLIALILLTALALAAIGGIVFGHVEAALALAIAIVGQLGALWLNRRGLLNSAGLLVLGVFLGILNFLLYNADGVHDIALVAYPIVILAGGLLLDKWAFIAYTVLTILSVQGIILGELNGFVVNRLSQFTSFSDLIYASVILFIAAVASHLLSNSIAKNITKLRASQCALAESNRDLHQLNDKLACVNDELTHEIIEHQRARKEILHLQHLLQNIADSMPSAIIALDADGRVLTWNPAAETMTGQTADQMKGQSLWKSSPALAHYRDLFEQVLHDHQVVQRHREPVGERFHVISYRDVDVFPLVGNGIGGAVLRIDDVTQRVQLEEMMLQSAKMASVGGLAAGVAHEINNPLGVMMQSAQVLQMVFDTQHPRTCEHLETCGIDSKGLNRYLQERGLMKYLQGIQEAGTRAATIVSDLLSFSRKSSLDVAPHDLVTLVEQTLELAATDYDMKKKYDFRDIEIVRELASDLPQVVCNGQQIQQVVLNLVRNAAQAMANDEWRMANGELQPRLTLRISCAQSEISNLQSAIRLEVEDNGPGIPEAVRARLFESFFTTKEVGEGTGLGLWLCWSIVVERHRGQIWIEHIAEGGTRFVVELPLVQRGTHVN